MSIIKGRKPVTLITLTLLLVFLAFCIGYVFDKLVDIWWYDALGYEFYFWQRLLYCYAVFIVVALSFSGFFLFNFQIASRVLRNSTDSTDLQDGSNLPPYTKLYRRFRKGSLALSIPIALGLAILIAMPLFHQWETFLFYIFGATAGVNEPVFGKDVSYFLFSFPVYRMIQSRLLLCFLILFLGLSLEYWTEKRLLARRNRHLPRAAKWHINIVLLIIFAIVSWGLILQRNELVYQTGKTPLFYGPDFVDLNLTLPLIWLQLFFWTGLVASLVAAIHYNKGLKIVAGLLVGFCVVAGVRHTTFLSEILKKYIVTPNEFTREKPYIDNNIQSTLQAYNLKNVEVRDFSLGTLPTHYDKPQVRKVLSDIPLWEASILKPVLEQLQQLRPYYTFSNITVDRYTVADKYEQVLVAPRELDYQKLPDEAQNWINRHMTYTHGYGVSMEPANQRGGDPMLWFMHDIPIQSDYGLKLQQPDIYYGLRSDPYAIAPNRTGEMDYPKGNDNVTVNYKGIGGVPLSSLIRKLVFAWHFRKPDIFFTTRTTAQSRILFRRNIIDRIRRLTPFLMLDSTPYIVANSRGIFWIQDAYTTSDWYPVSTMTNRNGIRLNYIRDSVKIVVDAYNGSVSYYVFDSKDPIVRTYSRIYPTLFKDKSDMPPDIRKHIRYPQDLFDIQMQIYAKYHQTDPKVFYQGEDIWTYAEVSDQEKTFSMIPTYLTLNLFNPDNLDFLLLVPMTPKGSDNLRSMAVAGCDGSNYGKIVIYQFPKGKLVLSPTQTYTIINEEPDIARQFTLWDQAGSKIVRGRVIILPIGHMIFYIQPIYLKSSSPLKIPELQRIIVSEGQTAVMESSMREAYKKLFKKLSFKVNQEDEQFPPDSD